MKKILWDMFAMTASVVLVALIAVGTVYLLGLGAGVVIKRWRSRRPVVCVCEVNGLVGICLRSDYDKASRNYWKAHDRLLRRTERTQEPMQLCGIIVVYPMFVFEKGNKAFEHMLSDFWVERRTFIVDGVRGVGHTGSR